MGMTVEQIRDLQDHVKALSFKPADCKNILEYSLSNKGIAIKNGADALHFHRALGVAIMNSFELPWDPFNERPAFSSLFEELFQMNGLRFENSFTQSYQYNYSPSLDHIVENFAKEMQELVNILIPNFCPKGKIMRKFIGEYLPESAPDLAKAVTLIRNGFEIKGFTHFASKRVNSINERYESPEESFLFNGPTPALEQISPTILDSSPISVAFLGNGNIHVSGLPIIFKYNFIQAPDAKHHYLCAHPYLVLMATIRHLVLFRSASKDPEPQQAGLAGRLLGLFSPPPRPVPA